ncbi:tetratricopeptide repeat protein [Lachnospiraceae bacterium NSJ-143]|nr:tetratricopeptide repeat protein [Lachnospiraceae bacterium NSJ-143]
MVCSKCGHKISNGYICPNCGADNILFQKARTASLRQYNKGVAFAKEGDYSSAIDALKECILFDKYNFVARNLLGISYFQIGLVTEALKEWIISASVKKDKNPAQRYIDSLQENARLLEKYSDGINMYNKALEQFRLGNDDLAVIQLKKSVDMNPALVDASNLLTAYYISIKDKAKAKKTVYRVLKIDKRNPKALEYLAEITSSEKSTVNADSTKAVSTISERNYGYSENIQKDRSDSFFNKFKTVLRTDIALFAAGIILTSAVFATLVMPSVTTGEKNKIDEMQKRISELEDENLNGTSAFAVKYKNLEEELKKLQEENNKYKGEYSIKQQELDIQTASAYIASERYDEAAEILYNLNADTLSDEVKANVDDMKAQCYPQAGETIFNSGISAFDSGNYEEAKALLQKSFEMAPKETFSDNALFVLAQISEKEGDNAQAKEYYSRIVNEYSNSDVFSQSENKITELSAQNG